MPRAGQFQPWLIGNRHHAALFDHEVHAIRRLYETGLFSFRELAERYEVNRMTITRLVRRETYTDLP